MVIAALSVPGCRKKPVAEPVAPPPAPAESGGATVVQKDPDLTALNAAYKKFWQEQKSPPAKLEDLVTKKYMTSLPVPPPGKKFNVDWATMQVTLVNK